MSSQPTITPNDFENPVAQNKDEDFAEVPDNVWSKVQRAPAFQSQFNEENIFTQQYFEAARQYYAQATNINAQGRAILHLFMKWADAAAEWTRFVLQGDADDPLDATLDWDPEGGGEAWVRPLQQDTWSGGSFGADYTHTPGGLGQYNLVPDASNGAGNGDTVTATANEQAWMIFGWWDPLAGKEVPYDYIQADVNDNVGVRRREFLKFQMEGQETIGYADRHRGPLLVEPGFDLDIDINVVTTGIQTGLYPIGIEVIRADAAEFAGVLG